MLPNKENKLQCTNVSNVKRVAFCFVFSMHKTVRRTDADKIAILAQHPKSLGTAGLFNSEILFLYQPYNVTLRRNAMIPAY